MRIPAFKRKSFVTNNADPTVVVEHASREAGVRVVEFQGVYQVLINGKPVGGVEWVLGAALHQALEELFLLEQRLLDEDPEQQEIEAAERRAGWDPNP
jgi:hypothetical protein